MYQLVKLPDPIRLLGDLSDKIHPHLLLCYLTAPPDVLHMRHQGGKGPSQLARLTAGLALKQEAKAQHVARPTDGQQGQNGKAPAA